MSFAFWYNAVMVEGGKDQPARVLTEPKTEQENSFRWTRDPKKPIIRVKNGVRTEKIVAVQITPYGTHGRFEYPKGPLKLKIGGIIAEKRLPNHPPRREATIIGYKNPLDKPFTENGNEFHHCAIYVDDFGTETAEAKREAKQKAKAKEEAGKGYGMEQAGQLRLKKQRNISRRKPVWQPGYDDIPPEFGPEAEMQVTRPEMPASAELPKALRQTESDETFELRVSPGTRFFIEHPKPKPEGETKDQRKKYLDETADWITKGRTAITIKGNRKETWANEDHWLCGEVTVATREDLYPKDEKIKPLKLGQVVFVSKGEASPRKQTKNK